jgi:cysteine desulfurase
MLRFKEALNSLDSINREVLALRHFEQLSRAEAALVLGISQEAGAKRSFRALMRLKGILATEARSRVAELINASPREIVFTSGATESINLALTGLIRSREGGVGRIVTGATEHEAVLETCAQLERTAAVAVRYLPVDRSGRIDLTDWEEAISRGGNTLGSLMLANNEIGTIHPIVEAALAAHRHGALFFSDLTQAAGKLPIDVRALGLDLAAFSAHKLYGPKGVGALFIRGGEPAIELEPLIVGGGQERRLRGGTLNVPGIVGFGAACRIARAEMADDARRTAALRDRLEREILAALPDVSVNGDVENRLPNTTNLCFHGLDARALIRDMHDVAVSTRSACSSGAAGPSHVLKALGLGDDDAYASIRFSLGRFTTDGEIDHAIRRVTDSVRKLRRSGRASRW